MNEQFQIKLLRLQADLQTRLRDVGEVRKALVYGLRATMDLFEVSEGAIAVLRPGQSKADIVFTIPKKADWDTESLTRYITRGRPDIPWTHLLAPVRRRGRIWAALVLRSEEHRFTLDERQALFSVTQTLTDIVEVVDEDRTRKVRRRIEEKIANRQEPKDLIYDIMHGLRSLTHYDHSASLLVSRDGSEALELVAEQIAWTKAKSKRIGMRLELDEDLAKKIRSGGIWLYERKGTAWQDNAGGCDGAIPGLLDYEASSDRTVPAEVAMVCAPITTPDGTLGLLKISARRGGVLGDYEAGLVEDFVPLTSLAVQFSVRTESLHKRILQSERKHALANLARGITHDVNNAMGAVLPLVQQMREDVRNGKMETSTLGDDLGSIETSIQTCRRIFAGMLAVARGSARGVGHGNLRRAIEGALSVLEDSLKRSSIEVNLDLPKELPTIRGSQGDLTQILLNLFTNARDAMPKGGRLEITATPEDGEVEVSIRDTGTGMPPDVLERVMEPFFTTKTDGSGLGLAICRSIIWDIGGDLAIESSKDEGTCVALSLPVLKDNPQEGE
jgi:two-component system NtrC family sensor kinase